MGKKAQVADTMLFYAIAVVLAVGLLAFGVKMFLGMMESNCNTEIAKFKTDLKSSADVVAFRPDSTTTLRVSGLCGATKLYFVDTQTAVPELIDNIPQITDSLRGTRASYNVFIVKGNNVKDSFTIQGISAHFPGYSCFENKNGAFTFTLRGDANGVFVENQTDTTRTCTPPLNKLTDVTNQQDLSIFHIYQLRNIIEQTLNSEYSATQPSYDGHMCIYNKASNTLTLGIGYTTQWKSVSIYHDSSQFGTHLANEAVSESVSSFPEGMDASAEGDSNLGIAIKIKEVPSERGIIGINYQLTEDPGCSNMDDCCKILVINEEKCYHDTDCSTDYVCDEDGVCQQAP